MKLTKTSTLTGKTATLDIPSLSEADYLAGLDSMYLGQSLQNAFRRQSADEREFIKTGITAEEWEVTFGD